MVSRVTTHTLHANQLHVLVLPYTLAVGVTRLMDLKRDSRAKEEQITLVRNRLERLKLEQQKV